MTAESPLAIEHQICVLQLSDQRGLGAIAW
jgi:hypothetical protein